MNSALRAFEKPSAREKANGSKPNSVPAVDERAAERRHSLAQRVSAGNNAQSKPSPGGAASTEHIFLLERNPRFSKQAHEFLFKVSFLVVLSLIADVALNVGDA